MPAPPLCGIASDALRQRLLRLREPGLLRAAGQPASVVALRRLVLRGLVRVAALVQPGLKVLRLLRRHAEPLRNERGVLQRVAFGHALVLEPAQVERLVCKRVPGPAGGELREAAVAAADAREVDAVEITQQLARLRREVRVVGRAPRVVELHASRFASRIDEARDKARAPDPDLAAGEIACDRSQLVLLPRPLLMAREAERRESADNDEENCNDPHQ